MLFSFCMRFVYQIQQMFQWIISSLKVLSPTGYTILESLE